MKYPFLGLADLMLYSLIFFRFSVRVLSNSFSQGAYSIRLSDDVILESIFILLYTVYVDVVNKR